MNLIKHTARLLSPAILILLMTLVARPITAQHNTADRLLVLVNNGSLSSTFIDVLEAQLALNAIRVEPALIDAIPNGASLILTAQDNAPCAVALQISMHTLPAPNWPIATNLIDAAIAAAQPSICVMDDAEDIAALATTITATIDVANGECTHTVNTAHEALVDPWLEAYIALGCYATNPDDLTMLWDASPSEHWRLDALRNAAIAHSLAQNFRFDEALVLDESNLTAVQANAESTSKLDTLLLAELFLLQGQHRLYLYEWDAVLEDYNTAISLLPDHAHAYYLRGMLNFTQNSRQAAYDDFTQYLSLESDHSSPFIPQATRYRDTLRDLLATPSP